jgi:hypothetical protein
LHFNDYIQDGVFPGQGSSKVYLFKLSTKGEGNGVDLVAHMQPKGDSQGTWLMFDHYKRVSGWIIMASHVYNPIYVKVMTIAVYDMQSKDIDSQIFMWRALVKS